MKLYRYGLVAIATLMVASCSDIDNQLPENGNMTNDQVQDAIDASPALVKSKFNGMFSMMGMPAIALGQAYPCDFGFISSAINHDLEAADMVTPLSDYNWFQPACDLTNRDPNYIVAYTRYVTPYKLLGLANEVIATIAEDAASEDAINMRAQACALRAFAYMQLAPYFQFADAEHLDEPCVPLQDGKHAINNNPRATVREVYTAVIEDLDWAVEHLTEERSDKAKVNKNVALGLRARANMFLGNWAEAAQDAEDAMVGYQPDNLLQKMIAGTMAPSFYDLKDENWMWGINITPDMVEGGLYAYTSCNWLCAFSGRTYATKYQFTPQINVLLYNQIPATDVRKYWWIDENLDSPLLSNVTWNGKTGRDISLLKIENVKDAFLPYTNVKFGMKSGVGSVINNNDWPLMRVEEMILIQAEGLAKSGKTGEAQQLLTNFVKTYRDESYVIPTGRSLEDEIWFQRRVELWGEGFASSDTKRLGKPNVRLHKNIDSKFPEAYTFNVKADDGWMNLRFPQSEMDDNKGIVNNEGGSIPVPGQNPDLLDGVTD